MSLPLASLNTQGQINWDHLGKQTITYSVDVLRRYQLAGVNPYTLKVGQSICRWFNLGPVGRRKVTEALSKLTCHSSWGKLIEFGFNVKSIPRVLAESDEGTCFVALAAALSDTYSPEYGGEVVFQIVACFGAPEEFTPSMSEWIKTVEACAGALSTSPFPLLVGHIIRQCEQIVQQRQSERRQQVPDVNDFDEDSFGEASCEHLAAALVIIGQVSVRKLNSVTIKGGLNVGFLAAIAEWLFDLQVVIREEERQILVYTNSAAPEIQQPQVLFLLRASLDRNDSNQLQVTQQTAYIDSLDDIVRGESVATPPPKGRVAWNQCFSSVFGHRFDALINQAHIFGTALGGASGIFEKASMDKSTFSRCANALKPNGGLSVCGFESPTMRGLSFVEHTLTTFPELDQPGIRSAAKDAATVSSPLDKYLWAIESLQVHCACECCVARGDPAKEIMATGEPACLTVILEAILKTSILLVRNVPLQDMLAPSRRGVHLLYERVRSVRNHPFERLLLSAIATGDKTPYSRAPIEEACVLFAGRTWHGSSILARSLNGICVYVEALRNIDLDSGTLLQYRVLPGRIEKGGHVYSMIYEGVVPLGARIRDASQHHPVPEPGKSIQKHLFIKLAPDYLHLNYAFVHGDKVPNVVSTHDTIECLNVQRSILEAMSRVVEMAVHQDCKCMVESFNLQMTGTGVWRTDNHGQEVVIWEQDAGRSLEEHLLLLSRIPDRCYIKGRHCIGRALAAAKCNTDNKRRPVFVLDI